MVVGEADKVDVLVLLPDTPTVRDGVGVGVNEPDNIVDVKVVEGLNP